MEAVAKKRQRTGNQPGFQRNQQRSNQGGRQPKQQGVVCHNCGQAGHIRPSCPHHQQEHRAAPLFVVQEESQQQRGVHYANVVQNQPAGSSSGVARAVAGAQQMAGGNNRSAPPPLAILPGHVTTRTLSLSVQNDVPSCLAVSCHDEVPCNFCLSRILILLDSACTIYIVIEPWLLDDYHLIEPEAIQWGNSAHIMYAVGKGTGD